MPKKRKTKAQTEFKKKIKEAKKLYNRKNNKLTWAECLRKCLTK